MATQRKMARTQGAWKRQEWHGFAFEIGPDTDLQGDGLLILERPDGSYEPVANVSTVNEAQSFALGHSLDGVLRLWARGINGRFLAVPVVIDGVRK